MNIFLIPCLLLGLTSLNAKNLPPDNDITLYNVLVNNCPNLNLSDTFKNQDVFQHCKSWKEIDQTTSLTEETKKNVLCLLYYDSFISFCNDLKLPKEKTLVNLVPDLKDYQVNKVCKALALFPTNKKFEHNVDKIISDEGICYKLCLNFDGSLVHECGLAHYFTNYNYPQLTQSLVSNTREETDSSIVKSEAPGKISDSATLIKPEAKPQQVSDTGSNSPKISQTQDIKYKDATILQNGSGNILNITAVQPANITVEGKNISKVVAADSAVKDTHADKYGIVVNEPPKEEPPKDSNVQPVPVENISEKNVQDTPAEEQEPKNDLNKAETELAQEPQSLDQPEPMMTDDQNTEDDEDTNDANYKDEDEKQEEKNVASPIGEKKKEKPSTLTLAGELPAHYNTVEELDGESYFFSYFMVICVLFVLGYVGYHNRQKVMALMLEGKRGKRQVRGRRPNSANYHKLDSNLEEAISSTCTKNSSHVIY